MSKVGPLSRADYKVFYPISTRWADNDIYGHVNNVTYYSYFDTAANRYLIEEGGLDIGDGSVVGYVVSSGCEYHAPITYPEPVEAGLRVDRPGKRPVQEGLARFRQGGETDGGHGPFGRVLVHLADNRHGATIEKLRVALDKLRLP